MCVYSVSSLTLEHIDAESVTFHAKNHFLCIISFIVNALFDCHNVKIFDWILVNACTRLWTPLIHLHCYNFLETKF